MLSERRISVAITGMDDQEVWCGVCALAGCLLSVCPAHRHINRWSLASQAANLKPIYMQIRQCAAKSAASLYSTTSKYGTE